MPKLRAGQKLRHGRLHIEEGEEFDCSEVDAKYYTSHKMASEVKSESEKSKQKAPAKSVDVGNYTTRRMTAAAPEIKQSLGDQPAPVSSPGNEAKAPVAQQASGVVPMPQPIKPTVTQPIAPDDSNK